MGYDQLLFGVKFLFSTQYSHSVSVPMKAANGRASGRPAGGIAVASSRIGRMPGQRERELDRRTDETAVI